MCRIKNVIFAPDGASRAERALHQAYLAAFLAAFAAANGFLALRLAACSCAQLDPAALYASYFRHPPTVLLNLLPSLLLTALGFCLTRRAWAAYLFSAVPVLGFALVNYYKIQLRDDPFLAADLRLFRTAGGILGHYTPALSRVAALTLLCAAAMLLFALFLLPNAPRAPKARLAGALVCLALVPLLYFRVYMGEGMYERTVNLDGIENVWSESQVFLSRGFWFPFIRSVSRAFPAPPEGYRAQEAEALLAQYPDGGIPPEKRVQVVGVMLEAFADLSDFPVLAAQPEVAALYEPLHELEAQSVSGDLLTNIFAGGTVDTEWGFLTGYSRHGAFRAPVASYVRDFAAQGYETAYFHPGYRWFYNRANINGYLGFQRSVFTENGFGALVDPEEAPHRSDAVLFDALLGELDARTAEDPPLFAFAVTYQNHAPYDDVLLPGARERVASAETGWSESACAILNNYFDGVADTIGQLRRFTEALEARGEPVVLVAFGDHKPWLGNDAAVYLELGVNLDTETREGFYNYYATPYLIWANGAAKEALGCAFAGAGGDLSPCLLMPELFDLCSWGGSPFLSLARSLRAVTPLVHEQGLFLENGALTDALSPAADAFYRQYRRAEYRRETAGLQ